MRTRWLVLAMALGVCGAVGSALGAPGRVEVSLNGAWETAAAGELAQVPVTADWQAFEVPGCRRGIGGERSWFRRRFTVPAEWSGQRVLIVYDGVKYASRHFVNGVLVGEHGRGYDRFALDLTDAVHFGTENELVIGCCDWQGTFSAPIDLSGVPVSDTARDRPREVGLTPIGGLFYQYGPWADVALLTVPVVHLADVTIRPSVRRRELGVTAAVTHSGTTPQSAEVGGTVAEAPAIALTPRTVTLAAGQQSSVSWTVPWPDATLWDFENPNLYHLRLVVRGEGQADDVRTTRFGFREFWCDGPRFRLNGTPVLLRSSSMWPLPEKDREAAAGRLRRLKGINVICFRTHTQPWRQHWYEAADEVGMLMIPEGPVFNDDTYYRLNDPVFWENYAGELRSLVGRLKNNPSVIAYSLENEFFGPVMNDRSPAKAELVRLGALMRELDPTRPFMYESDGDPGGVADIEGVHYPHELGNVFLYPNDAYWMEQPKTIGHMFLNGAEVWRWARRKPLYIGEYLWCPSPSPALYSILCGDDAYRNQAEYAQRAIGMAWSFQTRAYRAYRVSGLCPWTCAGGSLDPRQDAMAAAQAESMRPLAAFVKEYGTRLYGGAKVERTLQVMNDTLRGGAVAVSWVFAAAGHTESSGRLSFDLQPTDLRVGKFEFTPPDVRETTAAELRIRATLAGTPGFDERIPYKVYPALRLATPARQVGLLARPGDACGRLLAAHGIGVVPVTGLDAIPADVGILIIGRHALPALSGHDRPVLRLGADTSPYRGLLAFLSAGGRALVLGQTEAHVPFGPIRFAARQATLAFPLATGHPLLTGLDADDLRFWAPDHVVAEAQLSRSACSLRSIVVSGAESGLDYTALGEADVGAGKLVVCGLRVVDASGSEPAAGILLNNTLQYLDGWEPQAGRCVAVTSDRGLAALLDSLDLVVPVVPRLEALPDPDRVRTVLLGRDADPAAARRVLERVAAGGGTVWWHRPAAAPFEQLMAARGLDCRLLPASGPVRLRDGDPFTVGLARADLYWTQEAAPGVHGWAPRALAPEIIENALGRSGETPDPSRAVARLAATAMRVTGSEWNRPNQGGMILASSGTLAGELDTPTAGPVIVGLRAKGSPCQAVWPQVGIAVNGEEAGVLTVPTAEWAWFGLRALAQAGRNTVMLTFLNDGGAANEDRNVWFSEVVLQPTPEAPSDVVAHTTPAALASVSMGRGTLLVDTIRWDEPGAHAGQARTWLTSLLLTLGAQPRLGGCASVEAEELEFEAVAHNTVQHSVLCLANPGSVWVPVECRQAGGYVLRVYARGSAALEEWPILLVRVAGVDIGRITVDSTAVKPCLLPLSLSSGDHRLELRFINDYYDPGKADRNVWLDRIEVRPSDDGP